MASAFLFGTRRFAVCAKPFRIGFNFGQSARSDCLCPLPMLNLSSAGMKVLSLFSEAWIGHLQDSPFFAASAITFCWISREFSNECPCRPPADTQRERRSVLIGLRGFLASTTVPGVPH